MEKMVLSIVVMSSLAAVLGLGLSLAYSRLKVKEDPKVKAIEGLLPGINCGICGCASCAEFAKKLASKEADITSCKITVRNKKLVEKINTIVSG